MTWLKFGTMNNLNHQFITWGSQWPLFCFFCFELPEQEDTSIWNSNHAMAVSSHWTLRLKHCFGSPLFDSKQSKIQWTETCENAGRKEEGGTPDVENARNNGLGVISYFCFSCLLLFVPIYWFFRPLLQFHNLLPIQIEKKIINIYCQVI